MQISIDNVEPDEISKKSLKVLDKKLEMLAEYAEFHVNINSVVGGGIQGSERRAGDWAAGAGAGVRVDDRDHSRRGRATEAAEGRTRRAVYLEMTRRQEDELRAVRQVSGSDCRRGGRTTGVAGRGRGTCISARTGWCTTAASSAGIRAVPLAEYTHGGREAGVFDGEELRAELHDRVRAPDQLHRPLARAADADGGAGRAGVWWRYRD